MYFEQIERVTLYVATLYTTYEAVADVIEPRYWGRRFLKKGGKIDFTAKIFAFDSMEYRLV